MALIMGVGKKQFRFQPMSKLDNFMLAGCYLLTLAYLTISLRNLRAVKSRLGLISTVLTQVFYISPAGFL